MFERVILKKSGGAEQLQRESFELAAPGENDVQVRVAFSGINFADLMMRQGLYPDAPSLPFTPGYEISGVVSALGKNVSKFKVGDRIFAGSRFSGYSSALNIPADQVQHLPEDWSLEKGAACVVSFLTGHIALAEMARLRPGDKVLIDCASGSLGQICIVICKSLGVDHVVGLTSSNEKFSHLEDLGYKPALNQSSEKEFDFILNSRGGKSIEKNFMQLKATGRMVLIGASGMVTPGKRNLVKVLKTFFTMPKFSSIDLMNSSKGVFGLNVLQLFDEVGYLPKLLEEITKYELPDITDKIFDSYDVADAHRFLEEKRSRGKVLLRW